MWAGTNLQKEGGKLHAQKKGKRESRQIFNSNFYFHFTFFYSRISSRRGNDKVTLLSLGRFIHLFVSGILVFIATKGILVVIEDGGKIILCRPMCAHFFTT